MTLTPNDERLDVELSLPVFKSVAVGIRTPNPLLAGRTFYTTAPPLRLKILKMIFPVCLFVWQLFLSPSNIFSAYGKIKLMN